MRYRLVLDSVFHFSIPLPTNDAAAVLPPTAISIFTSRSVVKALLMSGTALTSQSPSAPHLNVANPTS